jgi:ribosome-binding protein aMBF1 (putative translation factor)
VKHEDACPSIKYTECILSATSIKQSDYFNETVATFGDRLVAARDAKGLTSASLAKKLGVAVKTIKVWENDGATPRGNKIQMLAGMLNVKEKEQ